MNAILSARNDTDQSVKIREIKKQEDYHGSKNSSITKRCETLHNRQIKRGISDPGFIPGRQDQFWYTATLTVLLQEQQFRSMKNWF